MKYTLVGLWGNGPFILSQLFEKAPCRTDPIVQVPCGTRNVAMPYGETVRRRMYRAEVPEQFDLSTFLDLSEDQSEHGPGCSSQVQTVRER